MSQTDGGAERQTDRQKDDIIMPMRAVWSAKVEEFYYVSLSYFMEGCSMHWAVFPLTEDIDRWTSESIFFRVYKSLGESA